MSDVNVRATLRDTKTGFTGTHETVYHDISDEYGLYNIWYHWTRGNYGCDCNRAIFLYEDWEFPCNPQENLIELVSLVVNGQDLVAIWGKEY